MTGFGAIGRERAARLRLLARSFPVLLKDSLLGAFNDNCLSIAKGAAYSALLAFFPVLTSATAILVETRADFVARTLSDFLSVVVPPGTEDLIQIQVHSQGRRPVLLLSMASLLSLWAAAGVIKSLLEGFRAVYKLRSTRGFWKESGVAVLLVLAGLVPVLAASGVLLFGEQLETLAVRTLTGNPFWSPPASWWHWLNGVARFVLAVAVIMLVTSELYYFGPVRRQRWRYVWPGAALTTVLWLFSTSAFAWYVRNLAHYNVLYGSISAGIALLVWMYLLALASLVGCEFNAHWEQTAGQSG
jgi:membrane protein